MSITKYAGKKSEVARLWQEFFCNPSEWRDHRSGKLNPRFPDFKHKKTEQSLWLESKWNPPWVEAKLAAIAPGTLESGITSRDREPTLPNEGRRSEVEKLWQELFCNPSLWQDHRWGKGNPSFPDFKHEKTQQSLWLNCKWTPRWVEPKLAAMAPGTIKPSSFACNQMLSRYAKAGQHKKTLELYEQMQCDGINSTRFTFCPVLSACASLGFLEEGQRIHMQIIQNGCGSDLFVGSSLIDMYGKCGSIDEARRVFNHMPTRSVVTWNAMIQGYVKCGEGKQALDLYRQMQYEQVDPDPVTFVAVLNACANIGALEEGKGAHQVIIHRGYETDVFVGNSLVNMYAKCGSIQDAKKVFDGMCTKDVVTWNSMILGYVKCGEGELGLELYRQMQVEQVKASPVTFVAVLNSCACVGALEKGRRLHKEIIERGYEVNVLVGNSLVDMYAKCGSIEDAERVFSQMQIRDVVTWNAMILGYAKCGEGQQALELYQEMQQEQVDPDSMTYVGVLNACANTGALQRGRIAHNKIIRRGYDSDVCVSNCLVDMYSKCGSIEDAERVFNQMPKKDVVTWNAMILGYVKFGNAQQALELYQQMQQEQVDPSPVTFLAVLNACASEAALHEGRAVHEEIIHRGYETNSCVSSCLVDMYSKCGSLGDAVRVFNQIPTRTVAVWNAMLAAYGRHGHAKEALQHFKQMCKVGEVDGTTFVCLLTACSHGGLVDDGLECFKAMSAVYNISPTVEHYSCVVDLLGRAGCLREAEDLIMSMPMDPSAALWTSLLSVCRAHVNVEVGERCAKWVQKLEPENAAAYVMLSDIYIAAGKRDSMGKFTLLT